MSRDYLLLPGQEKPPVQAATEPHQLKKYIERAHRNHRRNLMVKGLLKRLDQKGRVI